MPNDAMARRAWKEQPCFSINPVVDTYNALSMELCLPLGAWDLDAEVRIGVFR